MTDKEAVFIKETVQRFYGLEAIVRNYGSLPSQLDLHVETESASGMEKYDCIGVLWTRIDRPISIEVSKRNSRRRGNIKIAYRQGVIL